MENFLSIVLLVIMVAIISYVTGKDRGHELGMKELHSGVYECMTLPDAKIHCYLKSNKK